MSSTSNKLYTREEDTKIEKAICFLSDKYQASRKNKKPFLIHSIRVAMTLERINAEADIVVAAILHDILEDTDCKSQEVEDLFGKTVIALVEANSFKPEIEDYKEQYIEQFNRLKGNKKALIIKAADILNNRNYISLADEETASKVHEKHAYFLEIAEPILKDNPVFLELLKSVKLYPF